MNFDEYLKGPVGFDEGSCAIEELAYLGQTWSVGSNLFLEPPENFDPPLSLLIFGPQYFFSGSLGM